MADRFYKVASAREAGTLYQLRNVINRRNVVKKCKCRLSCRWIFIDVVTTAHVIAAALKAFGMSNIDDPCPIIPNFTGLADKDSKKDFWIR